MTSSETMGNSGLTESSLKPRAKKRGRPRNEVGFGSSNITTRNTSNDNMPNTRQHQESDAASYTSVGVGAPDLKSAITSRGMAISANTRLGQGKIIRPPNKLPHRAIPSGGGVMAGGISAGFDQKDLIDGVTIDGRKRRGRRRNHYDVVANVDDIRADLEAMRIIHQPQEHDKASSKQQPYSKSHAETRHTLTAAIGVNRSLDHFIKRCRNATLVARRERLRSTRPWQFSPIVTRGGDDLCLLHLKQMSQNPGLFMSLSSSQHSVDNPMNGIGATVDFFGDQRVPNKRGRPRKRRTNEEREFFEVATVILAAGKTLRFYQRNKINPFALLKEDTRSANRRTVDVGGDRGGHCNNTFDDEATGVHYGFVSIEQQALLEKTRRKFWHSLRLEVQQRMRSDVTEGIKRILFSKVEPEYTALTHFLNDRNVEGLDSYLTIKEWEEFYFITLEQVRRVQIAYPGENRLVRHVYLQGTMRRLNAYRDNSLFYLHPASSIIRPPSPSAGRSSKFVRSMHGVTSGVFKGMGLEEGDDNMMMDDDEDDMMGDEEDVMIDEEGEEIDSRSYESSGVDDSSSSLSGFVDDKNGQHLHANRKRPFSADIHQFYLQNGGKRAKCNVGVTTLMKPPRGVTGVKQQCASSPSVFRRKTGSCGTSRLNGERGVKNNSPFYRHSASSNRHHHSQQLMMMMHQNNSENLGATNQQFYHPSNGVASVKGSGSRVAIPHQKQHVADLRLLQHATSLGLPISMSSVLSGLVTHPEGSRSVNDGGLNTIQSSSSRSLFPSIVNYSIQRAQQQAVNLLLCSPSVLLVGGSADAIATTTYLHDSNYHQKELSALPTTTTLEDNNSSNAITYCPSTDQRQQDQQRLQLLSATTQEVTQVLDTESEDASDDKIHTNSIIDKQPPAEQQIVNVRHPVQTRVN